MKGDHRGHGEGPQAVQRWQVAAALVAGGAWGLVIDRDQKVDAIGHGVAMPLVNHPDVQARERWRAAHNSCDDGAMVGPVIIVIVLVVALPVGVLISGAIASALLGWLVNDDVERSHEGSELLDSNV